MPDRTQPDRPTDEDATNLIEAMRSLFIVQTVTEWQLAPFRRRLKRPFGGSAGRTRH